MSRDFGSNTLRVSPKLRMVCNCNTAVNVARSEHTAAVAVRSANVSAGIAKHAIRDAHTLAVPKPQLRFIEGIQRRNRRQRLSDARQ